MTVTSRENILHFVFFKTHLSIIIEMSMTKSFIYSQSQTNRLYSDISYACTEHRENRKITPFEVKFLIICLACPAPSGYEWLKSTWKWHSITCYRPNIDVCWGNITMQINIIVPKLIVYTSLPPLHFMLFMLWFRGSLKDTCPALEQNNVNKILYKMSARDFTP